MDILTNKIEKKMHWSPKSSSIGYIDHQNHIHISNHQCEIISLTTKIYLKQPIWNSISNHHKMEFFLKPPQDKNVWQTIKNIYILIYIYISNDQATCSIIERRTRSKIQLERNNLSSLNESSNKMREIIRQQRTCSFSYNHLKMALCLHMTQSRII